MKRIAIFLMPFGCLGLIAPPAFPQDVIDDLGLEGTSVTSISANYGILAVGTDRQGVYWQPEYSASDTGWSSAGLDTLSVAAVYAHKSGPIGWAISAGVVQDAPGDPFVYCSYRGGAFVARSDGISDTLTTAVVDLDGFPDPTICGETYAAGGRALYRRYFTDTLWAPVYTATHEGYIQTVKVRTEYGGVVLAGGAEGFSGFLLIKSTDLGENWDNISPPTTVISVDFSGAGAETIFAAGSNMIFRSLDGGAGWEVVWDGGGAYRISKIAYDPGIGRLYAAGRSTTPDGAAFLAVSTDDGESWQSIPLSLGPIVDLTLSSDWVFFATSQDGIFRFRKPLPDDKDDGPPAASTAWLDQNYPNPFEAATTISYELPEFSHARLTVYDILGREVKVMSSGTLPAGRHEVSFDATALPSGVYFYRLEAGELVETQQMVVQ